LGLETTVYQGNLYEGSVCNPAERKAEVSPATLMSPE
jgi:hypothetical protein